MADQEIATISQKLQEVKGKFQSIRKNGKGVKVQSKHPNSNPYICFEMSWKIWDGTTYRYKVRDCGNLGCRYSDARE